MLSSVSELFKIFQEIVSKLKRSFYIGHLNQSMGAARALSGSQCMIFLFLHLLSCKLHDRSLKGHFPTESLEWFKYSFFKSNYVIIF